MIINIIAKNYKSNSLKVIKYYMLFSILLLTNSCSDSQTKSVSVIADKFVKSQKDTFYRYMNSDSPADSLSYLTILPENLKLLLKLYPNMIEKHTVKDYQTDDLDSSFILRKGRSYIEFIKSNSDNSIYSGAYYDIYLSDFQGTFLGDSLNRLKAENYYPYHKVMNKPVAIIEITVETLGLNIINIEVHNGKIVRIFKDGDTELPHYFNKN